MLLVMQMLGAGGYRIEAAGIPGVAAADAFDCEPGAADRAVRVDRFDRVVRARRIETTARPEQWADGELVPADQDFEDVAHVLATRCQRVARLARKAVAEASRAGFFAATTMSTAGSSSCARRKDSRIRRRIRFRATPPPMVFTATARPTRGRVRPFGITRRPKKRSSMRRPRAYIASNSSLLRRRDSAPRRKRGAVGCMAPVPMELGVRERFSCGLWIDGAQELSCHPSSSYVRGT